jgi:hypothetical protein
VSIQDSQGKKPGRKQPETGEKKRGVGAVKTLSPDGKSFTLRPGGICGCYGRCCFFQSSSHFPGSQRYCSLLLKVCAWTIKRGRNELEPPSAVLAVSGTPDGEAWKHGPRG